MRSPLLAIVLVLFSLPVKADYVGVAGDYTDTGLPNPTTPSLTQPGDYVGVADGFYGDGTTLMPRPTDTGAPIPLVAPAAQGGLPTVTITPNGMVGSNGTVTDGNFTFVPEGVAAPAPPLTPMLTKEQRAIANNYPVNTYDGEVTDANPIMREYNEAADTAGLEELDHGETFEGRHAIAGGGPRTVTVNNNADWIDIWHNQIGSTPPGRLSRGQKAVVVFDAVHAYSGYAAEVEIEDEDSERIVVDARHITPSQRSAISPERNSPYAAIVLNASGKTVDVREAKSPNKG